MKKVSSAWLALLGIICFIVDCIEVLLLPIAFLILGMWQQLPWQYYAITIGGYLGVLFLLEGILYLFFKLLGRTYTSRFARKVGKYRSRFSIEDEFSPKLPMERN